VDATLNEIYRMSSVDPLSVPHAVLGESRDVQFRGYVIPKVHSVCNVQQFLVDKHVPQLSSVIVMGFKNKREAYDITMLSVHLFPPNNF
jgi:hypothetical protein